MIGLVLPGGGALCSWQAGCLEGLIQNGFKFDKILGISGGALTGASYFAGRLFEDMHFWRDADSIRALQFAPRFNPFSLFKGEPVWALVDHTRDEEKTQANAICDLTVVSLRSKDKTTVYSRFSPNNRSDWNGNLTAQLVASASIPRIYPRVMIDGDAYQDGGCIGRVPLNFDVLGDCSEIFILQPVLPEEGRKQWNPLTRYDQRGRNSTLKQMKQGVQSLQQLSRPPRITTLNPSKKLNFRMLDFTTRRCGPAVALGVSDGDKFARDWKGARAA